MNDGRSKIDAKALMLALKRAAELMGVAVILDHRRNEGIDGEYSPPGHDGPLPKVWAYLTFEAEKNPWQQLITLAHEFGHHLSFVNRQRPDEYEAALKVERHEWADVLGEEEKAAVVAEEEIAWEYASHLLRAVGPTLAPDFWGLYWERRGAAKTAYEATLWPAKVTSDGPQS